jgi:hypothetical protein
MLQFALFVDVWMRRHPTYFSSAATPSEFEYEQIVDWST